MPLPDEIMPDAEFNRRVDAITDRGIKFGFDLQPAVWLVLLAQIQLALCHPKNTTDAALVARKVCDSIVAAFRKIDPKVADVLQCGFGQTAPFMIAGLNIKLKFAPTPETN